MQKCANIVDLGERLQNKYLLTKIGFDTSENEPSRIWYKGLIFYIYLSWIPFLQTCLRRTAGIAKEVRLDSVSFHREGKTFTRDVMETKI